MSIRLQDHFDDPSRIVDESGAQLPLNASTRRVLICLAGYIQPGGTPAHRASAWPAQATLALHAGVSYDTVTRVLQRAERLGLLLAAKQFWTESRRGHRREQAPNRYTFHKATLAAAGAGRVLCVPRRGLVWDTLDRMAIKNRTHYIDRRHAEHQRRFDGFGTDGLRIWNELVDKGAAQWLQMLVFLRHIAGEKQIDVCFMRRDLVHGQRLGERGATFSPAGKGPLAVLDLDDLIDKPAPLKRWVKAGATARHEWNRAYALEAELHMRMSSQTRDVVMLDDLSEARVIEIRRRGLWRVVLETSPENFQVLMLLPVSVGADARQAAQASLASFLGGDLGSVAADKWHRLPGSKNNKMGPDGRGINWFCQMRDCCDGDPVPMAWLPYGWPVVHVSTVVAADVHAPDSSPVGPVVAQVPSSRVALGAITLPAGLAHIKNASVREFASAAEYLKAGAWLQDVLVYLAALADGRDKYKKVKGGALAYALRTLAGVMAEFEFSSDQQMRSLYVLHSEESRQLGCHPEDFPKARGAAAGRAARRLR